jgi:DNA-binding CsgD family transcriptional regulator
MACPSWPALCAGRTGERIACGLGANRVDSATKEKPHDVRGVWGAVNRRGRLTGRVYHRPPTGANTKGGLFMDREYEGGQDEFLRGVKAARAFWQNYACDVKGARDEAEKLEAGDQALAALSLFYAAVAERRLWRRYLRQFGYRIPRSGRVRAIRSRRGARLSKREQCATAWGLVNLFAANAIAEAALRGGVAAALAEFERVPLLAGHGMFGLSLQAQKDACAVSATGWARANLRIYASMREALPPGEDDRLVELGTATAEGFGDAARGELPADVINRISNQWASRRKSALWSTGEERAAMQPDPEAALLAADDVQVLDLLMARCTPAESRLLQAMRDGAPTLAEAARELGISPATARVQWHAIRRKARAMA